MTERELSDAELLAIPPVGSSDPNAREGPNPFADALGPIGLKNAKRWAALHYGEDGEDDETAIESDPFAVLRDALDTQKLFHEQRDDTGKLVAVHPLVSTDIGAFEARLITMTEAQEHIKLEAKPSDKSYRPSRLVSDLDSKSAPPKFEDSEESKHMRGLSRGD